VGREAVTGERGAGCVQRAAGWAEAECFVDGFGRPA
jgi:hypothetical protein